MHTSWKKSAVISALSLAALGAGCSPAEAPDSASAESSAEGSVLAISSPYKDKLRTSPDPRHIPWKRMSSSSSSGTTGASGASTTSGSSGSSSGSTGSSSGSTSSGSVSTAGSSSGSTGSPGTSGGSGTSGTSGTTTPGQGWLHTQGNHIYTEANVVWHARGANMGDTRSCNACTYQTPSVAEVNRRIDELVDNWHANFIRLDMESYATAGGRMTWASILADPQYLADIQAIVAHVESKPNTYVMLSLWVDPTFTSSGIPTAQTGTEWAKLADVFKGHPRVLYGLVNEPQANYDGAQDPDVWNAFNQTVATIRGVEDAAGTPHHLISVQGTGGWARRLSYYVTHPITAGGGDNIVYETHVYDPAANFDNLFGQPSQTLPVIIGEFGPASGYMTESDCATLMQRAEQLEIPYLAWTFHMRCPPNLLVDNSGGGCGVGMNLQPSSWGLLLKNRLANPY